MGDETRQITNKLEDVLRGMANEVTQTRVAQATLIANVSNMHSDVKKINGRVSIVEKKTDSLEKTRDEDIGKSKRSATIKKGVAWVLGIVSAVGGLVFGVIKVLSQ